MEDERCLKYLSNHPIIYVNQYAATAYAEWLNGKLRGVAQEKLSSAETDAERRFWQALSLGQITVGLPNDAEWEKAARGTDGRTFPWGEQSDSNRANYSDTGVGSTSAVGCFPGGVTPYGALDMAGNVWEWEKDKGVVRGGSWFSASDYVRCADRTRFVAFGHDVVIGFRVRASSSRK